MMLLVGHGLMGPSGPSGRSGAPRDAAHRASLATHPKVRFAPPKAGFPCAVAALPPFADAQASPCGARLATTKGNPVKPYPTKNITL